MRRMLLVWLALAPSALAGDTVVYLHDRAVGGAVHAFRLDKKLGTIAALEGSPYLLTDSGGNCGGLCQTMDSTRVGKQRFLLTDGILGVTPWLVAKDGTLTELPDKTKGGAGEWLGVTAVKKGGHVFVYANHNPTDKVHGFELAEDGTLTELADSPWDTGNAPDGIDSARDLVVCINEDGNSFSVFKVEKDGNLVEAPGSPVNHELDFAFNVHVDKSGRHVYSAGEFEAVIDAFVADKKTGELTALEDSPFDSGLVSLGTGLAFGRKPQIVAVNAKQDTAGQPSLQFIKRKGNGELLLVGEPQVPATLRIDVQALTDNGRFLIVASDNSDQVESLRVDAKTGAIESIDTEPLALENPNAIVILDL